MSCDDRIEQISALLDGELAAADLAALTAHIATCADCARTLAELGGLRAALAEAVPEEPVSAEFAARIERLLQAPPQLRRRAVLPWPVRRAGGWFAAGVAVAAMILLALWPRHDGGIDLGGVRDAALRASLPSAAAGASAGPAVPGYRLVAVRADVVAGHDARVLVYEQGSERITLCIWPAGREAAHPARQAVYRGMAIRYWNDGSAEFWAASPEPGEGLAAFVATLMRHPV
jgi:anti-sigma factor RsiW